MSNLLHRLWENALPFISMVALVALIVIGLFIFSYLLMVSAIIILILFIIAFIQSKITQYKSVQRTASGRTIEHSNIKEEWR